MWYNGEVVEEAVLSIAKPQNPGLVDTISAGYRALNRRPWALLIPAGVSAYLWLSSPLALGGSGLLEAGLHQVLGLLGNSPQARQQLAARIVGGDLRLSLAWLNMVPVLEPFDPGRGAITLADPLQQLGAFALINLLALLCSSLYLTLLGGAVRSEPFAPLPVLRRAIQVSAHICLALLVALGLGLLVGLPLLAISLVIISAAPAAAMPILLAWYIVCFWAYVYVGFMPEAILISHSGPLRALRHSINLVRRNMSGTLGLLLLRFLIIGGLGVVWHYLAVSPLGLTAAILGSAYIGSGLSAARLEFYRDQITRWRG
jgi:hypothetical protein